MKTSKTIWVHTLVCNEENYLWYAVMSVVDFVDKILLWDSGSTDNTVKIIQEIKKAKGEKIDFKEVGKKDAEELTKMHQQMLEQFDCDWFLIVDGDEVWWDSSIKKVIETIQEEGDKLDCIVSPYYNVIGDIYHFQEEEAGGYQIDDKKGHFNIRAVNRNIAGLHFEKPHGQEGLFDEHGISIQDRPKELRKFVDAQYMHFTNVQRSSSRSKDKEVTKRAFKFKYEIGKPFPKDFHYPEVFSRPKPDIVPSPWKKMSTSYYARASIETQLKRLKRKLKLGGKSGY